jgi:hypothetical protein
MIIKETNDPKVLKNYIRYVVGKYHLLAEKYTHLTDVNIMSSSDIFVLRMEKQKLEEDAKLLYTEIKNLYAQLGECIGESKLVDIMSNVNNCELLNSSQLSLFDDRVEAPPIIEFNEVELDNNDSVDTVIQKIQKI